MKILGATLTIAGGLLLAFFAGSAVALVTLTAPGCAHSQPAPFVPIPFDATDGSPISPCAAACQNEERLGCVEQSDCPDVLSTIEKSSWRRRADGYAMTCSGLALASSVAELIAAGGSCTPAVGRPVDDNGNPIPAPSR